MQPYGYIPLYHNSNDQRVIKFLTRNCTTHSLNGGKIEDIQSKPAPLQIIGNCKPKRGFDLMRIIKPALYILTGALIVITIEMAVM